MADLSSLYLVATNTNIVAADHNTIIAVLQAMNEELELALILAMFDE